MIVKVVEVVKSSLMLCSVLTLILGTLLVLGCGSSDHSMPSSSTLHNSPPPPGTASDALVMEVAAVLGVGSDSGNDGPVNFEHQPGGTALTVFLQDPGGSGEYRFDAESLTFSLGETVNFTLISETEFHTFTVDDLNLDMSADEGETIEFSFTFDTSGTYSLVCVPHEASGMVATIRVN